MGFGQSKTVQNCPKPIFRDKDHQCICNCCAEVLKDDAKPIVNRKERIKKHLTNCEHFWNKYKEEAEEILGNCDVDEEMPPSKHIRIDNVSNGWSFQWVNNPSTHALFHWLNLKLKLPDRKQLTGPILDQAIKSIEQLCKEKLNQEQSIKVAALVSDSAAAYASARRQLRLKYPQYVFLPCFAHQCNLAVGEIFKESSILKNASTNAVKLVNYFNHPNNVYFIGKLQNIQRELYSKYYAIIRPGDTRWNSYYKCYLSLIRTKQALRNLVTHYEPPEKTSSRSTELYLSTDICQIIMGDLFWSRISQLATLMKPYCRALDKLQIDKARLHDVALSFEYFIKFWEQNTDRFLSEGIISRLEKCWNDWEQPILLLSLVLHPKYRLDKFNPDLETINFITMGTWFDYYYKAWTSEKPTKLLVQFESY
ncbi:hypothetical protein RhiirA4_429827 [Rhizophagus irregularis]|uniref:DUF659 domain-containing protein n=1 Tax=Rhizophagus irregularis TaxID=588596 RepID=A0A2I1HI95_9GLOM|nr:hypothetical protein RhiirA4_429827 [Rhizophagus irregularis]